MNPDFKVLTNVGDSNSRTPIIQNRFRKLTLQSPQQTNVQSKMPERTAVPQSKLATEMIINRAVTPATQSQMITNKLMISTSSSGQALTETNFINVETEPFTNPLQVESTEHAQKSPKNSDNGRELTSQMEKLEVSRVSAELFSQYSSSSRISLPPNRILSNKENIENISQRMSNIRMSDLADTQPNTLSANKRRSHSTLADTQPNTAPHQKHQLEHSVVSDDRRIVASIVLSSDDEDNNGDGKNLQNNSLLTEESDDDDSVIEILSSDDSIDASDDRRVPPNKSAINVEIDELTESVAQKLNNFFDNIPKLDQSRQNFYKNVESNVSSKDKAETSEINIPETEPSDGRNHRDGSNVLVLDASQLDGSGKVSGDKADPQVNSSNDKDDNDKSVTQNSLPDKNDAASPHSSRQSPVLHLNESGRMSTVDSEAESRSVDDKISNAEPARQNQSTDEKQLSVREEPKKKIGFEKIKTDAKRVITLNSPTINVSATININIQVSGFSSTSSDTDATSENASDVPSEQPSKNDASLLSADIIDSSIEFESCRKYAKQLPGSHSEKLVFYTQNNKATDDVSPNQDDGMSPDSSVIEYSIIESHGDATADNRVDELPNQDDRMSPDKSVVESSMIHSQEDATMNHRNDEKESTNVSSTDVVGKKSTDASTSTDDHVAKESIEDGTTTDENTLSVTPTDTSVEIDECGELLLNCIYGDTWRTPQLIRKCVSTKKKCQTDVSKRDRSRGFSLFRHDLINSELDSTRISPSGTGTEKNVSNEHLDQSHPDSDPTLPKKDEEVNRSDADQSSRILRTCRKVVPNRILDYSDDKEDLDNDDNNDDYSNKSDQSLDSSFESASSEESDSSVEKPEPPRRKRKNVVFLDLTCNEVIEDEDHENPDATSEELEKVVENYLQSLETETIVQTPAPVNKNVPTNTARRLLFTPKYDDQTPFDEVKTPEMPVKREMKTIQLKTPIPSYLIPPQFRDNAKVFTEPITTTPSKNSKKLQSPYTPAPKKTCGFLESLDSQLIPEQHCDPEALKFRKNFKRHRNDLVKRLMSIYNNYVFDDKLKDVTVSWSKNLTTTAGRCHLRKMKGVRKGPVELSEKVLTSADRLRDTLVHELCHAAAWIIDGNGGNHGKIWKYWANRANKRFPELPVITRCHNYDIEGKYTYKCTICGLKSRAHSKSRKVENIRCAKCHGPIEVFLNKTDKDGQVILVPPKEPSMFAKYVKEKYKLHKVSGATHADVMKMLSNNFAKLTVDEKSKYK